MPTKYTMTRSHKLNNPRRGSGSGSESNSPPDQQHLPHYFAKRGPVYADPTKLKKGGGGRGNWGRAGNTIEIEDSGYNLHATREYRYHPNSSSQVLKEFRTKFEDDEEGEEEKEQEQEQEKGDEEKSVDLGRVMT